MHNIRTCYDCGAENGPESLVCTACGSIELTRGATRPRVPPKYTGPPLVWPWGAVLGTWPASFVCGVYGPKGSGKSSVAGTLQPDWWLTSEQSAGQAAATLGWVQGARWRPPEIREVSSPGDVAASLAQVYRGLVVLDSASRVGSLQAQKEAVDLLDRWAGDGPDRRAVVIWQVNAEGEPAGLTENQHAVDSVCGVAVEESGLRRLHATKNRAGPLGVAYFAFGNGLEQPSFHYSYSVEGAHGNYRLVPWPDPKARWAGLLDELFGELALPGLASAGRRVPGYPNDVLLPADVAARRAFAEAHGLTWYEGGHHAGSDHRGISLGARERREEGDPAEAGTGD